MVNAALIVMTILGCDDSVSQCHYIKTVQGQWESVAACDRQSQTRLPAMQDVNYPVVVAMCESAADAPIATSAGPLPPSGAVTAPPPSASASSAPDVLGVPDIGTQASPAAAPQTASTPAGLAQPPVSQHVQGSSTIIDPPPGPPVPQPLPQRAYTLLKGALPDGRRLKRVLAGPVHSLGEGYSWIARKVAF